MGKSLRYENSQNFIVTAVFADLPVQSTFHFDFLFNWEAQKKLLQWASNDFQCFVKLSQSANSETATTKINQFLQPQLDINTGTKIQLGLQPFKDRYLYSSFVNGVPSTGRIEYVRIFSWVALFILIIACINFMNLATARSVKRAKEIGLRKVIGSSRTSLIVQFFSESLLFALLALLVAVVLVALLLPSFNHFTGKQIPNPVTSPGFWLYLLCLAVVTGIIAGIYPALYLSSLQPVRILKGVLRFPNSTTSFRKGLTVFQFALSIILVITTIVITRQTNFVQDTSLGYNRENLLYIRIEGDLSTAQKYHLFKEEALNMPGIAMVDRSTETPHSMDFVVTDPIDWEGKQKNEIVGFKPASVGFDFIKLMNLQIAEGRGFSAQVATDSSDAFMVNEEAVKEMGMKNPIGKSISAWGKKGHIIGVLKDYNTASLKEPIKPVILDVKEGENFGVILVRMQPGKTKQALASLAKVYGDINPNYPLAYQFVDEEYKRLYSSELIIAKQSELFASLAIIISCLGLLGLVMFSAEQRVKEIGIRKVLGASMGQVVALLAKDFLKLIMIAFVVAAPLSWVAMHRWLQDFAYRIPLSVWIFIVAGCFSAVMALLTVSFQAIKAAVANPVKSLRTE